MMTDSAGSASLEIDVSRTDTATVLTVRGEIDLGTAPHLNESIDAVLAEAAPAALIVDLTDVVFFASVGMTVLLDAAARLGDAATFAVVADEATTARPMTLVGLDQTLSMFTDLEAALAAVAGPS
mgnify:CR=1 FL=1